MVMVNWRGIAEVTEARSRNQEPRTGTPRRSRRRDLIRLAEGRQAGDRDRDADGGG